MARGDSIQSGNPVTYVPPKKSNLNLELDSLTWFH